MKKTLRNIKQKIKAFAASDPSVTDLKIVSKDSMAMEAERAAKRRKKIHEDMMKELDK